MPRAGRFPSGYKSGGTEEDGVPLTLLDERSRTAAILSPTIGFFDNVFNFENGTLRCGIPGTTTSVPTGTSQSRLCCTSQDLTGARNGCMGRLWQSASRARWEVAGSCERERTDVAARLLHGWPFLLRHT